VKLKKKRGNKMTFEEQVKRLEEILQVIEDGKAPLEEVNKLFSEGVELSKNCFDMLEKSKGKVTVLQSELQKMIEKPYN